MTSLNARDRDLHDENGEHITTPPTADGHQVELWQARIERRPDDFDPQGLYDEAGAAGDLDLCATMERLGIAH